MPHPVLRKHITCPRDPRQKPNGSPLRESRVLDCIPCLGMDAGSRWYLHESQRSVAVFAIDQLVWTALSTADTYYDEDQPNNTDLVRYWHKNISKGRGQVDFISGMSMSGAMTNNTLYSDPCRYFLAVVEKEVKKVLCEYAHIISTIQDVVQKRYVVLSFHFVFQNRRLKHQVGWAYLYTLYFLDLNFGIFNGGSSCHPDGCPEQVLINFSIGINPRPLDNPFWSSCIPSKRISPTHWMSGTTSRKNIFGLLTSSPRTSTWETSRGRFTT